MVSTPLLLGQLSSHRSLEPVSIAHVTSWKNLSAKRFAQTPELLAAWDRLNAQRGDLPFLVSTVVLAALEVFGLGSERLLFALEGDWVVAMFVLVPTKGLRWRTFQPS